MTKDVVLKPIVIAPEKAFALVNRKARKSLRHVNMQFSEIGLPKFNDLPRLTSVTSCGGHHCTMAHGGMLSFHAMDARSNGNRQRHQVHQLRPHPTVLRGRETILFTPHGHAPRRYPRQFQFHPERKVTFHVAICR